VTVFAGVIDISGSLFTEEKKTIVRDAFHNVCKSESIIEKSTNNGLFLSYNIDKTKINYKVDDDYNTSAIAGDPLIRSTNQGLDEDVNSINNINEYEPLGKVYFLGLK